MRTVDRTASILLALAMVTSLVIVTVATPISVSAGGCPSHPHGTTIPVVQGGRFLLRYRCYYDEPGYDGMFSITLVWYNYENKPDENLTFLSARAYWDNQDNLGMDVSIAASPSGADTMWTLSLDSSSYPTPIDDNFTVDIWMGACGVRGICHEENDNHPILGPGGLAAVSIAESTIRDIAGTEVPITIDINAYTPGVILWTGPNAFDNTQPACPPKYVYYPSGPIPLAAVQRVGSGAVLAGGLTSDLDNLRWNSVTPPNPYENTLDELLDAVFQWMVPGADNVLWFTGYGVFQKRIRTTFIEDALIAKGYTVTESNLVDNDITVAKLAPYDILVIPGFQLGARWSGGNPALLPDNNVEAIDNWVRAGGGLMIFNNADFAGYNFYRVHNKILAKLGFNWRFQCDSVYDNVDNYGGYAYYLKVKVENTGPGGGYRQVTGKDNIGVYSATSLVPVENLRWSVDVVSILPSPQSGIPPATLTYTVTITNTGTAWDNYDISVSGTDNVNFARALNKTRLFLAAGATDNSVTVQENILAGTPYCTWDTITVTATGTENTGGTQATDSANALAHATAAFNVELTSITPSSQYGDIGSTVTATVVATNTGAATDNLTLSVIADSLGWGAWLTQTVFLNVAPSGTATTTLNVPIPGSALPLDTDSITVQVQSGGNPLLTDSKTCTVTANLLRSVSIQIIPGWPEWPEAWKDPVTFVVKIKNTGSLADKYYFTLSQIVIPPDPEAPTKEWSMWIEPQEIYLKPGQEAEAALSVTPYCQAWGSTEVWIDVEVHGKLATGSKTDLDNAENIAWTMVHENEKMCCDVNVWPQEQTGHPSSDLVWVVTVRNMGNVKNIYYFDPVSQIISGRGRYSPGGDWVGGLDKQTTKELKPGEEETILLRLHIPEGEQTCTWNDIDVRATSIYDPTCTDIAWTKAQVLELEPRIPEEEIKLQVEAGIVAIDVRPTYYDFGVLQEDEQAETPPNFFTIRNVGNENVMVMIRGTDAVSKPGEPVAKWFLGADTGVDTYVMYWTEGGIIAGRVTTKDQPMLKSKLLAHTETYFDIKIITPSTFTVPAKMWMKVILTAIKDI